MEGKINISNDLKQLMENPDDFFFDFHNYFNTKKKIFSPVTCDQPTDNEISNFMEWVDKNGAIHPKVKYPALFENKGIKYPGMLAIDDIGEDEVKSVDIY